MDFEQYNTSRRLRKNTEVSGREETLEMCVGTCVNEIMNAAVSFHRLHLKVKDLGSYAGHKALNELYDALPEHADDIAEEFQGRAELLLEYPESSPKTLKSVEEAVDYIRELTTMAENLQLKMPYSEIVNILDEFKSTLNGSKYKLLFLK